MVIGGNVYGIAVQHATSKCHTIRCNKQSAEYLKSPTHEITISAISVACSKAVQNCVLVTSSFVGLRPVASYGCDLCYPARGHQILPSMPHSSSVLQTE